MTAVDFEALPHADLVDDGGRALDARLLVSDAPAENVRGAVEQGYAVMAAGGLTSAINSFDFDSAIVRQRFRDVVAVRSKGALTPELVDPSTPMDEIKTNQISIDHAAATVTAGAGLTFAQVNAVLAHAVSPMARVLVDLTSVGSAWVGGVVSTGGMGPMRLRPSATVESVCLADGSSGKPVILSGDEARSVEGLQGWAGVITAARMRFFEVPPQEFGLVLPMQSTDVDGMATLLAYLHDWTNVDIGDRLLTGAVENTVMNGVELISRQSLEQFIAHASDPARSKAEGLLQSCDYAGADMLICLTGWSDASVDDVLMILLDENETIGGVPIDFGVGFSSGAEMDTFRAIREGAPDLARTYARVKQPGKMKPWTTSTDVNLALPKDSAAISQALTAYDEYRQTIAELRDKYEGRLEISLAAYGHVNPHGLDPHHRVTIVAPEGGEAELNEARALVQAAKKELIRALVRAAEHNGGTVTGGEKGVPSAIEIARALGGEDKLPANLRTDLERARARIGAAHEAFSFRAPNELR